jgi:pimeloyl-ACP methyl ester carboxylesterase
MRTTAARRGSIPPPPTAARALALGALLTLALALAAATSAHAEITFKQCSNSVDFACGHLVVPIDPGGPDTETITLAIRRHRAPVGEAHSAIVALAGGPGQPALPFTEQFLETLGPAAATRDLIVYDQRGVGLSHPLSCHAFEHSSLYTSVGPALAACAAQMGPSRAYFTSELSAADIEAIRVAGGYEKLVLYGTSYGTKVAEDYAQQHPQHVEALILDSVVTPTGPEPLGLPTFAAVRRILAQLCARRACAGITGEPASDLSRLVARSRRGRLSGTALDGSGHSHRIPINGGELFGLLLAGDFSPLLRGEFVTDVSAAAHADYAPLARLLNAAGGGEEEQHEDFDNPLYYATTCEEQTFPWNRASSAHGRVAEATTAANAFGAGAFAPFDTSVAIDTSDVRACADWPYTTPAPAPETLAMPNVPTLILSGEADLRTPTAEARALAAQIPDAHVLVVPYTGHAVLEAEPGDCARNAVIALLEGKSGAPKPCSRQRPVAVAPPPLPPPSLDAVAPERGVPGKPGRTLHAVALTLRDLARQLALQISGAESLLALSALKIGGLRSGWLHTEGAKLTFSDYSYVPGVTLSGTLSAGAGTLHVAGADSAPGALRSGSGGALSGELEGRHVSLPASALAAAAIVRTDAAATPDSVSADDTGADLRGRVAIIGTGGDWPRLRQLP